MYKQLTTDIPNLPMSRFLTTHFKNMSPFSKISAYYNISTNPIWEMVEKANIRLILVCAMAARFPINSDAIDKSISICCQSIAKGSRPSTNKRMVIANAANFGAPPIIKVTAVGAPW